MVDCDDILPLHRCQQHWKNAEILPRKTITVQAVPLNIIRKVFQEVMDTGWYFLPPCPTTV
jgi:hypothetical protein